MSGDGRKLLPVYWEKGTGIRVLNPDGWASIGDLGPRNWDEEITLDEFHIRASHSTVEIRIIPLRDEVHPQIDKARAMAAQRYESIHGAGPEHDDWARIYPGDDGVWIRFDEVPRG